MKRLIVVAAALLLSSAGAVARAAPPPGCDAPHPADKYQLLRRLSLDLRGRLPAVEEYEALDGAEAVPLSTIRGWMKDDSFRLAMRRYHEAMFWPNLSAAKLHSVNALLMNLPDDSSPLVNASERRRWVHRNDVNATCGNFEQTRFDPAHPGEFRPVVSGTVRIEGWRLVHPYWAPNTTVKVCAYDAQETRSVVVDGVTLDCSEIPAQDHPECGCGPGLRYCYGPHGVSDGPILDSMREQLALAVDDVTVGVTAKGTPAPYTDLLLSTKAFQNGPIAFWKRYLAPNMDLLVATYERADPDEEVLPKAFTDTSFDQVDRKGLHAGVVTLPAYLLRFQTDRGRANRFRINFLCQYFVPPDHLSDAPPACGTDDPDLQKRCNCRYCHQTLEPFAAWWGSFAEAGSTLMSDRARFPRLNPACVAEKPSLFCNRFYVTAADGHNPGSLLAWQWTDVHQDLLAHIEGGPRMLAQQIIDSGEFARCAVKRAFFWFVRREMHVTGDQTDEVELLDRLSAGFVASGYSFPWLVEQVVTLPQYGRAR